MQIRQHSFFLIVSQNQFYVAFAKLHSDLFSGVTHFIYQLSGSIVKRNVNPGLQHNFLEAFPFSFLRIGFAFEWIAIWAFKHAGCHVGALIRQKAASANGSGYGRAPAFALVDQELFLVLKGFKVFITGVKIAPETAGAKIANVIAKRIAPGDNVIDALGWFFEAVSAVLPVHHEHL